MSNHWTPTAIDTHIAQEVSALLPSRLFDIHAHLYRADHMGCRAPALVADGPPEVDVNVWRSSLSNLIGHSHLEGGLFLPYPVKGVDPAPGNEYILSQVDPSLSRYGLVVVSPTSREDEFVRLLANPGVRGFKPYHVFARIPQTFDATLEQFIPEWAWRVAHDKRLIILIHLVRSGALADCENQRALRAFCTTYPAARVILAHAARGFHAPNTIKGLESVRDLKNVWFDTSAVCEAEPLMALIKELGPERLMWGSDFPVSQQRGKCVTVGDAFSWICPERIDVDPSAPACHPTLVGLESLRALTTAARLLDLSTDQLEGIFFHNALNLLK